jgi:nicotinamide-nucleotide amidase
VDELIALGERVGVALEARGLRLASAESCTGGLLAAALTAVPGSSRWFERGFIAYSDLAKEELLGVRRETLAVAGSVSEAVVRELALGALARSPASLSIAISGVAGPGGGTERKPVGGVWIAWAVRGGAVCAAHHLFRGDRNTVRSQSVRVALEGLIDIAPRASPVAEAP